MRRRPNVLFVTTDQQRYDSVGFMGNSEVHTPYLDALAAGSTVFERCYVTNPVCMPSRATLLTGQFPDAHGGRRNGVEVPDPSWGTARALRRAGWRTGMFGKTHYCPLRRDYAGKHAFHDWRQGEDYYGFEERSITHDLKDYVADVSPLGQRIESGQDKPEAGYPLDDYADWMKQHHPEVYGLAVREGRPEGHRPVAPELWTSELPVEHHQTTWITDRTLEFIDRHHDEPFFAWCSYVDPHHPFNAPRSHRERYDPSTFAEPVGTAAELDRRSRYHQDRSARQAATWREHWREYRAQYYGMISLIDDQVGRIVRHLEETGLAENTLVIFTSDHGEMLGDHALSRKGLFHYEQLLRVPLLVHWPGRVAEGTRQAGIVQNVDLPATILDAATGEVPAPYQGISLLPWIRGQRTDDPRSYALVQNGGEGHEYDPWPELRTLITERWKLQYYVGEDHLEIDDLESDPDELSPRTVDDEPALAWELMDKLAEASSKASMWGPHIGRW